MPRLFPTSVASAAVPQASGVVDRPRIVNGFRNPVAGLTANYVSTFALGTSIAVSRLATDGPRPDTQTCFRVTGTPSEGGSSVLAWGYAAGGAVSADGSKVNNNTGLLVYVACRIKVPTYTQVAGQVASAQLYVESLNASQGFISNAFVANRDLEDLSGWTLMEGFGWLPNTVRNAGARMILWNTNGQPIDVRVSDLCIIVDPVAAVSDVPVGSRVGHTWSGAAHDSPSALMKGSTVSIPVGFNELTPWRNRGTAPTVAVTDDEAIALQREVGATAIRNGGANVTDPTYGTLPWPAKASPINFDSWYWDKVAQKIRAAGLKWLPIAGGQLPWMAGSGASYITNPTDLSDAVSFWAQLVARYRDIIVGVEWMNEPNLKAFWGNGPNGADYMTTLRPFYDAVKAVAPEIPVISGGISPVRAATNGDAVYTTFLTDCYANGLKTHCDAIGFHPYPATTGTGGSADALWGDGHDLALYNVWSKMKVNTDTAKKVWITEFGMETDHASGNFTGNSTERQQAQTLGNLAVRCARDSRIGAMFFHELLGSNTTDRFHVVQGQRLRRRRGFYALQQAFGAPRTRVWSPWRVMGGTGEGAFSGAYTAFAPDAEPPQFRENGDTVQARGIIKKGSAGVSGESIYQLPAGTNGDADLSPAHTIYRDAGATGEVNGRLAINQQGILQWNAGDPSGFLLFDFEYALD